MAITKKDLIKIGDNLFEIPMSHRSDMRVPARVYMSDQMIDDVLGDKSLEQLVNVATLPGIQQHALAMPDIHQGYGFPIGGVAATAIERGGVISPGGIGYDINCGVRLLVANSLASELHARMEDLATAVFRSIPSGVGKGGKLTIDAKEMDRVLLHGAQRMLEQGYGEPLDIELSEERGCMSGADASLISDVAKERGKDQLGTLGSGNHFLEIQVVDEIFEPDVARAFGLSLGAVTVMIHCGSRGLGHQTCTDHVKIMMQNLHKWQYELPDRELVCAPFSSHEGKNYYAAMAAAANFGWANRHVITHFVRDAWQKTLGTDANVSMVYDVSHNLGKREEHVVDGERMQLLVHRKGATRAFGVGSELIPLRYRSVGQPVLIPGTMGTASYVMVGDNDGLRQAFGSTCHGAGRRMSRAGAKKTVRGSTIRAELESRGIVIRCVSDAGLAEEAPAAYKDVDAVVNVVHNAQLARKVARLRPLAVIKGG